MRSTSQPSHLSMSGPLAPLASISSSSSQVTSCGPQPQTGTGRRQRFGLHALFALRRSIGPSQVSLSSLPFYCPAPCSPRPSIRSMSSSRICSYRPSIHVLEASCRSTRWGGRSTMRCSSISCSGFACSFPTGSRACWCLWVRLPYFGLFRVALQAGRSGCDNLHPSNIAGVCGGLHARLVCASPHGATSDYRLGLDRNVGHLARGCVCGRSGAAPVCRSRVARRWRAGGRRRAGALGPCKNKQPWLVSW